MLAQTLFYAADIVQLLAFPRERHAVYHCFDFLSTARLPPRLRSASRVYLSASANVVWPSVDMISCAVHPASAIRRPSVLRRPCGWQSRGRPAAVIASRIKRLNVHRVGLAVLGIDNGDVLAWCGFQRLLQVLRDGHLDRDTCLVPSVTRVAIYLVPG